MKFRQFLEGREVIGGVEYWVNPSVAQVKGLVRKWKRGGARFIYNVKTNDFTIWDGLHLTHFQAFDDLGGEEEDHFSGFIKEFDGTIVIAVQDVLPAGKTFQDAEKILGRYGDEIEMIPF